MKIIHTGDIHLGSKMEAKFSDAKSSERKIEVRLSFKKMVDFAVENDVKVIMLCGDVFDSDIPLKKDKEFFYGLVEKYPSIDFLYLKGNHDTNSFSKAPSNLKEFSDAWRSYRYGNVNICGIEQSEKNCLSIYNELNLNKDDINIVMLHGQIASSAGFNKIQLQKLCGKNIDYLALGHIHKREEGELDLRGVYRYCGCLEGRGFDDIGEKGFYLLDTQAGRISSRFVENSIRRIYSFDVDISGAKNSFEASKLVKKVVVCDKKDIVRVNLKGTVDFYDTALAGDVQSYLDDEWYTLSVKDETELKMNFDFFKQDLSLRGEFVREVLADESLDEAQKKAVIAMGFNALNGREVFK